MSNVHENGPGRPAPVPNAEHALDYALSMLGGLAEMAASAGLDSLAGDLAALASKHGDHSGIDPSN